MKLEEFLIEAKKQTYANANVEKSKPNRTGSNDYEYSNDYFTYHDTYFGGINFMGEEVVYEKNNNIPIWGMNYYGKTIDTDLSEEAMDKALRPALMLVGTDNTLPIRGPKSYENDNYKYTFIVNGDITNFEGIETIYKDNKEIFILKCHGGLIKK